MRYFLNTEVINKDIKEYDNNNTGVTQNGKFRYDYVYRKQL